MPQFNDHIAQAISNLSFLESINVDHQNHFDWKVTVCYYVAVHLINAHLALHGMQFRKHVDVKAAINPEDSKSVTAGTSLDVKKYLAYTTLQMLSRRSRYLVNEKDGQLGVTKAQLTYSVHYARALRHLNTLIEYFNSSHNTQINPISILCSDIRQGELKYLTKRKETA